MLNGKVLIAGYKVTVQIEEYSENFKPIILTGNIDTVKIMVCNNTSAITPITAVEKIPKSEWLTA